MSAADAIRAREAATHTPAKTAKAAKPKPVTVEEPKVEAPVVDEIAAVELPEVIE